MSEKKKIYLCHPYSHPDSEVMHQRFLSANDLAGRLIKWGFLVFSPLSHSVPIADTLHNHKTYDVWLEQDDAFVCWADEIWIPLVDGWMDSKGIAHEEMVAFKLNKPVVYFAPKGDDGYRICEHQEMLASMAAARKVETETRENGGLPELFP